MFQLWDHLRHGKTLNVKQVQVRPSAQRRGILTDTLNKMEAAFKPDTMRIECVLTKRMHAFCAARKYRLESDYEGCCTYIKTCAPSASSPQHHSASARMGLRALRL